MKVDDRVRKLRNTDCSLYKLIKDLVQIYDGEETKNGG